MALVVSNKFNGLQLVCGPLLRYQGIVMAVMVPTSARLMTADLDKLAHLSNGRFMITPNSNRIIATACVCTPYV
jgi:hypothetical protein